MPPNPRGGLQRQPSTIGGQSALSARIGGLFFEGYCQLEIRKRIQMSDVVVDVAY
jgi:hypothetical protein